MSARGRDTLKPNIQAAISAFAREHDLPPGSDATAERFVAHLVLHDLGYSDFDIEQVASGGVNDNQIDAFALSINGEFVGTVDDVETRLGGIPDAAPLTIEFVALQITMAERWSQSKIYSFAGGVSNLFETRRLTPENERLADWRLVKDALFRALAHRERPARRVLRLFLACASENTPDAHVRGAQENGRRMVERMGLFDEVRFDLVDGHRLEELNGQWRRATKAVLQMGGMVALPPSPEVARAWIGWARATDFLKIIASESGGVRPNAFFENVRGYLGADPAATPVNADIARTLQGPEQNEFVFRNNGIAIIARSVEPSGPSALALTGYQIVNGCQTSYTLFEQRAHLTSAVSVPLKVVETTERSAIRSITAATNSQTPIGEAEFLSQLPFVRKLQNYFSGKRMRDPEASIWFERRANEYAERRLEAPHRVVSLVDLIEIYLAAFEQRPHLVHGQGWKAALPRIDRDEMLTLSDNAELYYACGLLRWRVNEFVAAYAEDRARPRGQTGARRRRSLRYPARHQLALAIRLLAAPDTPMIARPSFRGGAFDGALATLIAALRDPHRTAAYMRESHDLLRAAVRALSANAPFAAETAKKKAMTDYVLDHAPRRAAEQRT